MTKEQEAKAIENNWDSEAVEAYLGLRGDDALDNFEEAYQGQWDSDEEFVQQLLEDIGDVPDNFPGYVHIDWERTAHDVMMDYTEQDGYYFRD